MPKFLLIKFSNGPAIESATRIVVLMFCSDTDCNYLTHCRRTASTHELWGSIKKYKILFVFLMCYNKIFAISLRLFWFWEFQGIIMNKTILSCFPFLRYKAIPVTWSLFVRKAIVHSLIGHFLDPPPVKPWLDPMIFR